MDLFVECVQKLFTLIYFRFLCSLKCNVIMVIREMLYWSVCIAVPVKIWTIKWTHLWELQDGSICLNQSDSLMFKQLSRDAQRSCISKGNLHYLIWKRSLHHFPDSWDSEKHHSCEMLHEIKNVQCLHIFCKLSGLISLLGESEHRSEY